MTRVKLFAKSVAITYIIMVVNNRRLVRKRIVVLCFRQWLLPFICNLCFKEAVISQ